MREKRRPTRGTIRPREWRRLPTMQLPPPGQEGPPLAEADRGPPEYKWDPDFPGTLKPGTVEDNFPLHRVLSSDVYENMVYQELDMDERCQEIFEPDDDLLEWLAKEGRLIPRDANNDDLDLDVDTHISSMSDDDLDFADDDSKMIAYYSRQGEGSTTGASSDFGGFSESSVDVDAGF